MSSIAEQFGNFTVYEVSWDGGRTWVEVPAHFDVEKMRPTYIRLRVGNNTFAMPYTAIPEVKELPGIDIRDYQ